MKKIQLEKEHKTMLRCLQKWHSLLEGTQHGVVNEAFQHTARGLGYEYAYLEAAKALREAINETRAWAPIKAVKQ